MTNNKIFLIGGAKDVGKTSVSKVVASYFNLNQISISEILRESYETYTNKEFAELEAKEELIEYVLENKPIIANVYYATEIDDNSLVPYYEKFFDDDEIEILSKEGDLELILVDTDPHEIYKRRKRYNGSNFFDMNLVYERIVDELAANRKYFDEYCKQLNKEGYVIKNVDFGKAVEKLYKIVNELYAKPKIFSMYKPKKN